MAEHLQYWAMERSNVELMGPRGFGLHTVIEQLPEEMVEELILLAPKAAFDNTGLNACLKFQYHIARRLEEIIAPIWDDPYAQFAVVCGEAVYASRRQFIEFDQVGFECRMPHLATIVPRPEPEVHLAPLLNCSASV